MTNWLSNKLGDYFKLNNIWYFFVDYFARDLQVAGFWRVLETLVDHKDDNIKKRALIMVTRQKAKQLEEDWAQTSASIHFSGI